MISTPAAPGAETARRALRALGPRRAARLSAVPLFVTVLIATVGLAGPVSASTVSTASTLRAWHPLEFGRMSLVTSGTHTVPGAASRVNLSKLDQGDPRPWPAIARPPLARSASVNASSSAGSAYTAIPPTRLLDTRVTGGAIGPGNTLDLQVAGVPGVPTSATAVVANVTAISPTAAGFLTVWPAGMTQPVVSNLNFAPGETVANSVTVPVGSGGEIAIFNSAGQTGVAFDVDGYYSSTEATTGAGLYNPVSPFRALGSLQEGALVGPGAVVAVSVTGGSTGVPASATAVVVNLTAAHGTAASFLTAYGDGATQPTVSNLNFAPGEVVANRATVPVGANGQIDVYNHAGSVNLDVDVSGFYSGLGGTGSVFVPISPVRLVDTRTDLKGTPIAPTTSETFSLTSSAIPTSASAVAANFTAISGPSSGYATIYPSSETAPPTASDINWTANRAVPNYTIADTAGTGSIAVFASAGSTVNLVIDAFGYFASPGTSTPAPTTGLAVTTTSLPSATVGSAYSATLAATGGTTPYSWAVSSGSLPSGLSLSSGGEITGTPSVAGTSSFTVEVTDSSSPTPETATAALSIAVASAPPATTPVGQSSNWSGYAVTSAQVIPVIAGDWTVPSLDCAATPDGVVGLWVGTGGIVYPDGSSTGSLLQTGVTGECVDGTAQYYGWWTVGPQGPDYSGIAFDNFPVSAGDQISATVFEDTSGGWSTEVTDLTTGLTGVMVTGEAWGVGETEASTFTEQGSTVGLAYAGGTSAEWILEDPGGDTTTSSGLWPFADYSPTTFNNLEVAGSQTALQELVMVQSGVQLSTPSALTSSGFSVAYGPTPPPAP